MKSFYGIWLSFLKLETFILFYLDSSAMEFLINLCILIVVEIAILILVEIAIYLSQTRFYNNNRTSL